MKIDRGLLATLVLAAFTTACASAGGTGDPGGGGGGTGGPRITVSLPDVVCSTGRLAATPMAAWPAR